MSKTFKIDKESFEVTDRIKSRSNKSRKLYSEMKIQKRRRERQKEKELYGRYHYTEQDME